MTPQLQQLLDGDVAARKHHEGGVTGMRLSRIVRTGSKLSWMPIGNGERSIMPLLENFFTRDWPRVSKTRLNLA